VRAFGVSPFALTIADASTVHSKNERIYLPAYLDGVARTERVVREYALAP
jgi:acetylornithine deacetylase/succinyl-diaminopimelate desuccinylase-like protein